MKRPVTRNVVLALLGIVAVALTATTVPTARQQERSGSAGTGPPGSGDGGGLAARPSDSVPQLLDLPLLTELAVAFVALLLIAALWALIAHRRTAFRIAVVMLALLFVSALIAQYVPMGAPPSPSNVSGLAGNVSGGGGGGGSSGTASSPSFLSFVLVVVVGVALLGTALAANRRRDGSSDGESTDGSTGGGAAAVGRAAGRAADRIEESTDLDNEVYRAWREMTTHLDVSRPETHTAREFEQAAVAAGMASDDVAALTDLFERARYDETEVTGADEQRAVELLRRIERRYAEDEP